MAAAHAATASMPPFSTLSISRSGHTRAKTGAEAGPMRCNCAGEISAFSNSANGGSCTPLTMYCQRSACGSMSSIAGRSPAVNAPLA